MQSFSHHPAIPPAHRVSLFVLPEHPCNYFADRTAQSRAIHARGKISADVYHDFMDAGFRRSGRVIYQPICRACRDCIPIRVPVDRFAPSKSQRRCWRRNQDLSVTISSPTSDDESFALYASYLENWHGDDAKNPADRDSFESFLYDSPVNTIEFRYRNSAGRLLAVGLCDVSARSLSSVYFYFDPYERKRSLGTFGALVELSHARLIGVPYYYLGYWVYGCATMTYKSSFRPFELLDGDGTWRARDA